MKLSQVWCRGVALMVLASAAITGSTGCMSGVGGPVSPAGTIVYVRGELDATLANGFDAVDKAAKTAVANLRFVSMGDKRDAFVAIYDWKTAEDKKVTVKVVRINDALTKVEIRVELFGNETLSRMILEKIQAEL